jgi:hypothetical protein
MLARDVAKLTRYQVWRRRPSVASTLCSCVDHNRNVASWTGVNMATHHLLHTYDGPRVKVAQHVYFLCLSFGGQLHCPCLHPIVRRHDHHGTAEEQIVSRFP